MDPHVGEKSWDGKKAHYQDVGIVDRYNKKRFKDGLHGKSTRRKWSLIQKALHGIEGIETVMDLPCGTGRFTQQILNQGWRLINSDISNAMLSQARDLAENDPDLIGSLRADAEALPLADSSIDLVLCIRFLMHVPREVRPAIFREFARVTKRWVVLDVRHTYCINTHMKRIRSRFNPKVKVPNFRYTMKTLNEDIRAGGLRIKRHVWNTPPFSEKLVLLCEAV